MANIVVDLWQDFDFVTLNATNLGTNDHNVGGGTWNAVSDPDGFLSTSTSGEKQSGGTFSGNADSAGTRGLALTPPTPSTTDGAFISFSFTNDLTLSCSYGFWYQFPSALNGNENEEHDILYVENQFGTQELYVKQTWHSGRAGNLFLYTGEAGYSSAIAIGGMADTWIWITAQHNTGGAGSPHRLRAYTEDGVQIGSEQTRTSHATSGSHTASMGTAVGALEGHGGSIYFDDWIMDWTDSTFPLGPPSGGVLVPRALKQRFFLRGVRR